MREELELYIHIPFCLKKCAYCDFLSGPADEHARQRYVDALVREIGSHAEKKGRYGVSTVFFGGGTPSVLEAEQTARIMEALRQNFRIRPDAEITIEVNPGTLTREKLRVYRDCGFNRLSIGLQSANDAELRLLGRIHTYGKFLESYHMAREAEFANINLDLISAIPGQTCESYRRTLEKIVALAPEHISAYSLIIEEGTPFYERYGDGAQGCADLPDEETERELYRMTKEILGAHGYRRYEISNYARPGYACRHNLGYWERKNYLGLGLGASSLLENVRWANVADMDIYLRRSEDTCVDMRSEAERLDVVSQMEEYMFLGLRKTDGVSERAFERAFGRTMQEVYGAQIRKFQREGLLAVCGDRVRLTERGIDVSNYVMSEFLIDRD